MRQNQCDNADSRAYGPHARGVEAARAGMPADTNPYIKDSNLWLWWLSGWTSYTHCPSVHQAPKEPQ